MTLSLPASRTAWDTPAFAATLARELAALPSGSLPLQQALVSGGVALEEGMQVMLLGAGEENGAIRARVGIFYAGVVAGCNCADDPTPVEPCPEYCELLLTIDRASATTTVTLSA